MELAIAEHSICQPGLPSPQGELQTGSPGLDFFHKAKSCGFLFSFAELSTVSAPSPSFSLLVSLKLEGSSFA